MTLADDINSFSNAASTIIGSLAKGGVFGVTQQKLALGIPAQQGFWAGLTGAPGTTTYAAGAPATPTDWSTILLVAGVGVLVLAILLSRTAPGG